MEALLQLKDVSKEYKEKRKVTIALNDISLNVEKGEFLAIVGRSGAGKSTLLNILGLLDSVTDGKYLISGKDTSELSDREKSKLRNTMFGFVLQDYGLIDNYTVYENVEIPLEYSENKLSKEEKRQRISEILSKLGLEDKIDDKSSKLSGGQRQRVAIARALINHPKIVLADEPTGALDSITTAEIIDILRKFNESENLTVVIVTHNRDVEKMCDRVIVLEEGEIK